MAWSRRVVVRMLLVSVWAVSLLALVYPARVQAQGGEGSVHVVEAGETVSRIARQYGIDVATLLSLNDLANANLVYEGQRLVVSGGGRESAQWEDQGPSQAASNDERQGGSWEAQGANGPYQRAGMAWEPEGTQRSPYRDDWEARPVEENAESASDSASTNERWEPQGNPPSPYTEGWEDVHAERTSYSPGSSWEPQASVRESRQEPLTGEKWIEIDLSDQVLTAYQGDTVVRDFIISSGSSRYPTVTGSFRTYHRTELQDMSGGSEAAGDYYYQPDVPWVQYFFEGYAIHGAYWHNSFGVPIGHGCINMRVEESRWLYDWAGATGIRVEVHQ